MRATTLAKRKNLRSAVRNDPVIHIENVQGVKTLEAYQKTIARAVYDYDNVAIRACHDVGKTFTMGKVFAALMSTFPGSIGITTAPTFRQVEKLLWGEIRHSIKNSIYPLGGKIYDRKPEWTFDDKWYAIGFTPKKEASNEMDSEQKGSSFQGFHGKYTFIVFDEATGVPKQMWDAAEGMRTSANVKFICIGNPTTRNSEFYNCFNGKKARFWKQIHISCFDSPNLIANGVRNLSDLKKEIEKLKGLNFEDQVLRMKSYEVVNPYLITLKWVVEMAIGWGLDHPLFLSKVLGDFPSRDSNALFDLQAVIDAQNRGEQEPSGEVTGRFWGVDPARYGEDKTIITVFENWRVTERFSLAKKDTEFVAQEITQRTRNMVRVPHEVMCIDAGGLGAGVFDKLISRQETGKVSRQIRIVELNFANSPALDFEPKSIQEKNKSHYHNLKARMFHQCSKDLADSIILKEDEIYQEEMPTIRYEFVRGKMKIESKDEYKKRTGRGSPDNTDSLVIANFGRYFPAEQTEDVWAQA